MVRMKGKRGAFGHVEIILSFILFVGFLLFLFIIFNPVKESSINLFDLEIAEREILKGIMAELNYTTLSINEAGFHDVGECFSISSNNLGVYVEDKDGKKTPAYSDGNKIVVKKSGRFYTLFYFRDFAPYAEEHIDCEITNLAGIPHEIGSKRIANVLYNSSIDEFSARYYGDYENFKTQLGLSTDFGFIVYDSAKNEIMKVMKDKSSKAVFSEEKGYQLLYNNGTRKEVVLNIQIW